MSVQDVRNSSLRIQRVPFLIGTGLSIVLCIGLVIFFYPFEKKGAQSSSTSDDRESDTFHRVNPVYDADSTKSKKVPEESPNIASIFELPTFFESSVALDDMLKNADTLTLVDLIDPSHSIQGVERRQSTQVQLFQKFATLDPIQAISRAQSFPEKQYEHFASLIYREWSVIDLDIALAYAEQHVPTLSWDGKYTVLEQIFRTAWDLSDDEKLQIATRLEVSPYTSNDLLNKIESDKPLDNPAEAWTEVLSAENLGDDEWDQLIQIALAVIEKDGFTTFADLANAIPDFDTRIDLISLVLFDKMETDEIGTVFEQAVQLFHETAEPVLFEYVEYWSELDPRSALDAMSNVPSDQLRKHLEELVIETWIQERPMEVVQQLDLLPLEYRERALSQGIRSMSSRHPKEATEYLHQISDPQTKWSVMWNLLQNWAHVDIEEAFTWFLDNPELELPSGRSRASLLQSLLFRVLPDTAPSLVELALKYSVDNPEAGWEGSIVGAIAHQDITKAKELLPQVRTGPGRFNAYVAIGWALFNQDQSMNSVIELAEELPEKDHAEFYGKLLPRLSPQVAYEHIDDLPSPDAQAKAALGLLQKAAKSAKSSYTDEQLDHLESFLTSAERNELELDSNSPQQ